MFNSAIKEAPRTKQSEWHVYIPILSPQAKKRTNSITILYIIYSSNTVHLFNAASEHTLCTPDNGHVNKDDCGEN